MMEADQLPANSHYQLLGLLEWVEYRLTGNNDEITQVTLAIDSFDPLDSLAGAGLVNNQPVNLALWVSQDKFDTEFFA